MKNITEFILEGEYEHQPYGLPRDNKEYNAVGVDDETIKEWEDHFKNKKQFKASSAKFGFGAGPLPKNLYLQYPSKDWTFDICKNKSGKWFILKNTEYGRRIITKPWPHKNDFFDSLEDVYKVFDDEKKFK